MWLAIKISIGRCSWPTAADGIMQFYPKHCQDSNMSEGEQTVARSSSKNVSCNASEHLGLSLYRHGKLSQKYSYI